MFGKMISQQGKRITIELDEDFDSFKAMRLSEGQQPSVELTIDDKRHISPEQRKKIWALINDFCNYTGDVPKDIEERFKWQVQMIFGIDHFSLSDCSKTVGNYMILTILDFMFREDIPFRTKIWDSLDSDYLRAILSIRDRCCVICGRPHADLCHYKAVGIGRNRHKIDERKMMFMSMCRIHHQEQHRIGIQSFLLKYHIKPIRLTDDQLIKYHILGKKRLAELNGGNQDGKHIFNSRSTNS